MQNNLFIFYWKVWTLENDRYLLTSRIHVGRVVNIAQWYLENKYENIEITSITYITIYIQIHINDTPIPRCLVHNIWRFNFSTCQEITSLYLTICMASLVTVEVLQLLIYFITVMINGIWNVWLIHPMYTMTKYVRCNDVSAEFNSICSVDDHMMFFKVHNFILTLTEW